MRRMVPNDEKSSEIVLTGSAPAVPRPRLDESQVIGCEYLHYPWDDWHRWSLAQGLNERLAGAGRLLIREAYNHSWDEWLKAECGWSDDGQALLDYALRFPQAANRRWDILMRTDGLRGDFKPRSVEWTWGYLKADARRLVGQIQRMPL